MKKQSAAPVGQQPMAPDRRPGIGARAAHLFPEAHDIGAPEEEVVNSYSRVYSKWSLLS
jgi:hypothetical protein